MHAAVRGSVRRSPLRGYPYYVLYYREHADHIEVLSVFHTSRDPKSWQKRI
jgi:plasmid stabilization system protein ParE